MSTDKNYFAFLSAAFYSCRIAPMESESDNPEGCAVDSAQFSIEVHNFPHIIPNKVIRYLPPLVTTP